MMRACSLLAVAALAISGALAAVAGTTSQAASAARPVASGGEVLTVPVLRGAMVHFCPDTTGKYEAPGLRAEDSGRVVVAAIALPDAPVSGRIKAQFTLHPVPKAEREMWDRWDRAGNVRLVVDGEPDLEIVRFVTAYGGRTEHEVDVSELAPLLRGARTVRAFVDTWVSPAWRIDFTLRFEPDTLYAPPTWAMPIYYTDSFNRQEMGDGVTVPVTVPPGLGRVVLRYLSTGHCTDGRDDDEFESKANVIAVDGIVVERFHPWRDDCRRFRERNPYCARWSDGSWSSDYSRSGWCPGVEVPPYEFDLTDHLTPGEHTIRFVIENMRPKDAEENFGYWRVSACLIGWDQPPRLWCN